MSEWKKVKLGEICDYVIDNRGITPTKANTEWKVSGYKVLSAKNIKTGKIVQEDTIRFIDEIAYKRWMKKEVERGDIFVTSEAPFGEIYYWDKDEKIVLGQRLFGLKLKKSLLSKFVYYQMTNYDFQMQMSGKATGTTVIGLRQPELLKCEINLPPLEEQKAIADVLASLDDKIELNNKINKNLEEQAQALFKRWFVDFEFPNEDGNPYKSSGGEMIDSELGLIPKDWEVGVLSQIVDVIMGQSPVGSSYNEEKVGTVFFQGRAEFGTRFPKVRLYTTKPTRMANANSILLSVRAPVGDINVAQVNCCIGRGLASIKSNIQCDSFILYTMKNLYNELDKFNGEGTVFGSINKDALNGLQIVIAPNEIIMQFNKIANYLDEQYCVLDQQNQKLAELRDYLLPKLMSGEIRVKL